MATSPSPFVPNPVVTASQLPIPAKPKPKKKGGGIDLGKPGDYSPPAKGSPSERATFTKFILAHPSLKPYSQDIWEAARHYGGFTATEYAAVLVAESGGRIDAKSSVGALGLAQIYDNAANAMNEGGVPFFRPGNLQISNADKLNPKFAINYLAWRLSGYKQAHGGNIDQAWMGGYNPNYSKTKGYNPKYISQFLPKGYVPTGSPTITDTAGKAVDTSAVEQGLKDPWVVGVSKAGKLIVSSSPVPPKNAVLYDGAPMTATAFKILQRNLDTYFRSFTGGRPDPKTTLEYINKGWSPYSLTIALSKSKNFTNSPIYKKFAPSYQDVGKDLVGPGSKVPFNLIRTGIVNGWDSGTFAAVLRQQGSYIDSNEMKDNTATLATVHQSIMGIPDSAAQAQLKQAALAGWKPNQYAAWLRSQPQYTASPEYQTKALSFLGSLGLITGQQAVLKKGPAPVNPNQDLSQSLPNDKRLPAADPLKNPEDTVATYNG